jgi:hypothetical protein
VTNIVKVDLDELLDQVSARQTLAIENLRTQFTRNGRHVRAAEAFPLTVAASGTPTPIDGSRNPLQNTGGRLVGYALVEATGAAAAEVDFLDGRDSGGTLFLPVSLAPGESARDWFGPAGIQFTSGLYAMAVTGAVRGTVFIGRVDL